MLQLFMLDVAIFIIIGVAATYFAAFLAKKQLIRNRIISDDQVPKVKVE